MRFFTKALKDWLDGAPPAVQPATGLARDRDFDPASAGHISTLRAWVRDRWYEADAKDLERIRPTFTRDPRAIQNERLKRERLDRERRDAPMFVIGGDEPEFEPAIPRAERLPPSPRPQPSLEDLGDWDYITPPVTQI